MSPDLTSLTASSAESHTLRLWGRGAFAATARYLTAAMRPSRLGADSLIDARLAEALNDNMA